MKLLKPILSLILGLLVLISSTSFTVNMHLCMGHVQAVSLIEPATPCIMELMAMDLAKESKSCSSASKKGCCEEKSIVFDGTEYQYKASEQLTLLPVDFVTVSNPVVCTLDHSFVAFNPPFELYKPPLIERDVPVLVQSFLI